MNEVVLVFAQSISPFVSGLFLGTFFFGGLWWTVRRALSSRRAELWFALSLLLRTFVVLAGFYYLAISSWQQMLACLIGFVSARVVIFRFTKQREGAYEY